MLTSTDADFPNTVNVRSKRILASSGIPIFTNNDADDWVVIWLSSWGGNNRWNIDKRNTKVG